MAMRSACVSEAQRVALTFAFDSYRRNMPEPLRLWRQAGLALTPEGDAAVGGDDGAASAPFLAAEVLCERIERIELYASACSLHRALFISRFFSIVTPRQLAGLLADSFPFVMRPVILLAPGILDGEDGEGP